MRKPWLRSWCQLFLLAAPLLHIRADEIAVDANGRASRDDCDRLAANGQCEREPQLMARACAQSCAHLLLNAAYLGDGEMVELLIMGGAAPSTQNAQGATALHFAAHGNKAEVAKMLLGHGAPSDARDARGTTPLHYAAHGGHLQVVQALLSGSSTSPDLRDNEGGTALHLAAYQGEAQIVRALIAGGSNVDARDHVGVVALHRATYKGHTAVVQALIDGGATADVQNVQGVTPLHRATSRGDATVVRTLLSGGAAADTRDNEGKAALAFAAYHGHLDVVHTLLTHGAALDAADGQGKTALQWAAMGGQADVARELLERGAKVDATDRRGKTALHHAARQGQTAMVRVLLEGGASFVRSEEGVTPVDTAIYNARDGGALAVLQAMLEGGRTQEVATAARAAAAAAHPWTGQTPVHIASYLGRRDLVELLVAHGAVEDSASHLQAGDGLRERDPSVTSLAAAHEAYATAARLDPKSRAAAARLRIAAPTAAVIVPEAGATAGSAAAHIAAARTMEHLSVHVHAEGGKEGGEKGDGKDVREGGGEGSGQGGGESGQGWVRRAVQLWRQQGAVVFPSLLNASVVQSLREAAETMLQTEGAVDLSGLIRQSSGNASLRTLRPLPVSPSRGALAALASTLAPFLAGALMSPRQLLLDFGAYRTSAGSDAQEWHTDSPFRDGRIAHVQISLVDTGAQQGELQVQPATHGHQPASGEAADAAGQPIEREGPQVPLAPVPAGTVSLYRLDLLHRGGRHALPQRGSRLIGSLKLMGEHAFVPDGIPLKMLPDDAGRWWLEGGDVVDRKQ